MDRTVMLLLIKAEKRADCNQTRDGFDYIRWLEQKPLIDC